LISYLTIELKRYFAQVCFEEFKLSLFYINLLDSSECVTELPQWIESNFMNISYAFGLKFNNSFFMFKTELKSSLIFKMAQ